MQDYAKAAKDLLNNVAKLAVRQATEQLASQQLLHTTSAPQTRASLPVEARVSRFKQELLSSRIDLNALRSLAFYGIPDKDGLRAITWKLLLGYLPPDPSEWDETMARRRTQYLMFCQDLIVDPKKIQDANSHDHSHDTSSSSSPPPPKYPGSQQQQQQDTLAEEPVRSSSGSPSPSKAAATAGGADDPLQDQGQEGGPLDPLRQPSLQEGVAGPLSSPLHGKEPEDHPLSLQSTSKWHTFFKDNEIMEQIDRDVMRTHPDMHFFSGDTPEAEEHRREMKRALFMFAKLNPGLRYIQGMNELLAPLYYMFKNDPDTSSSRYAEADAFYCFVDLISEFRDHFCQQLDNSSSGIRATISKLVALLEVQDPQLAEHLAANKVDPQFFAFRWITLLLTQEFSFPDAVRIWDTLLSDSRGRLDCLLRVCLALMLHVRQQLLEGDFAHNVKLLQRYPSVDVNVILAAADQLPACSTLLGAPL